MSYPMGSQVLVLVHPIAVDGREIKELNVRRPKVRDNLIASKQETDEDREMTMMSLLTGEDTEVLSELDMSDYSDLQAVVVGFRKKDLSKSETSKKA